ncbi:unnamed protein product [Sphagnum compactum]
MFLQLEQGCLEVYRHKVDHASHACAQLHQDLVNVEVELAALFASLGDPAVSQEVEIEVARLDALKANKMKEVVMKRRIKLEEDENRFASKGAHLNLKCAERAINKLPGQSQLFDQLGKVLSSRVTAIMQPGTLEAPQTNGMNASSQMSGKDMKQDRTQPAAPLNYVNLNKDEVAGLASAGGSAPTSPWDQ